MKLSEAITALVRAEIDAENWIANAEHDEHFDAEEARVKARLQGARQKVDEAVAKIAETRSA